MNLKQLLLTATVLASTNNAQAQAIVTDSTKNIKQTLEMPTQTQDTTKDAKTFMLDQAYVGSLSNMNFPIEKLQAGDAATSVRMGVGATYAPFKNFQVNSWAILDENKSDAFSLEMMQAKTNVTDNLSVSVGKLGRASANLRPHPVSGNGHFETWTESQIPGLGKGARIDAKVGETNLAASVTVNNANQPEYNARVTLPTAQDPVHLTGWYTDAENFGAATSGAYQDLSTVAVYKRTNDQDIVANKLLWIPYDGNKGTVIFYSDAGYDLDAGKFVRAEMGILAAKTMDNINIKNVDVAGLTGVGYDAIAKEIKAYLFVTLEWKK
jgi:hypothetical protein